MQTLCILRINLAFILQKSLVYFSGNSVSPRMGDQGVRDPSLRGHSRRLHVWHDWTFARTHSIPCELSLWQESPGEVRNLLYSLSLLPLGFGSAARRLSEALDVGAVEKDLRLQQTGSGGRVRRSCHLGRAGRHGNRAVSWLYSRDLGVCISKVSAQELVDSLWCNW